ncbi:MAG: S4 domain-containing protein, partial [Culicoidibacterales bacterium]
MRINKFISEAGVASRRGADKLIEHNRVTINGRYAKIGSEVHPGDDVRVNGNQIYMANNYVYLALNKPVGIISTTEKYVKGNIADLVNHP